MLPSLTGLLIITGIFWTTTYILIIKRGFQDKTFGMPLTALCVNLSWEFIYSFVYPEQNATLLYVNKIWFAFDIVILLQVLLYAAGDFKNLSKKLFYPGFILMLGYIFYGLKITQQIIGDNIDVYSAFADNLMMSALFIALLIRRNNVEGQSIYIALTKLLGTLAAFLTTSFSELLCFLYMGIFLLDSTYTILLYKKCLAFNIKPWKRW